MGEGFGVDYTGNTGVVGPDQRGSRIGNWRYIPVELPTGDFYGGHRPGNNLFGETVLAVDLKTGKRKWHYQLVHHGIWDMDIPCAPMLVNITINGQTVKALAQPTKQAFLYVFDRVTGKPIWPIEERPVEQSTVPGEKTSPTQPFPTKPPAYDAQGLTVKDLIDFTPELRAASREDRFGLSSGACLYSGCREHSGRSLWHAGHGYGGRGNELARRIVRS